MKKLILSVFATIMLALTSPLANGQNNVWSLPPNYLKGISLQLLPTPPDNPCCTPFFPNDPTDPSDGYDGQPAVFAHNAMQDANGNLLFFIVDNYIYNKDGYVIQSFNTFTVHGSELMIVPAIDNCNRYYIFSAGTNVTSSGGFYAIFDFNPSTFDPADNWGTSSLSEHLFACVTTVCSDPLIPINENSPGFSFSEWGSDVNKNGILSYAASPTINNQRYIYCQLRSRTYVLSLTSTGLVYVGKIPHAFLSSNLASNDGNRTEMELVKLNDGSGNYRMAFSSNDVLGNTASGFFYADINANTGLNIPGTDGSYIYPDAEAYIHGLEFSADGQFLYLAHNKTATVPSSIDVFQFGVSTVPTPVVGIPALEAEDFQNSQIEIGKDGKLYFATNNRLATYNPTTSTWVNTSLSINYNINSNGWCCTPSVNAYTLPDQIDGMDYSATFAAISAACCVDNSTFSTTTYDNEQSGTQSWTATANPFGNTSPITVKDELIIKSGANITANNLTFKFAPNAKLVVESGAKFTVNNCTLTVETSCENAPMWNGVDVMGSTLAFGQQTGAGRFIANNSLIEHAYWAVHNFKTQDGGVLAEEYGTGYRGGVIIATNTTFRNNHRAMVFFDFQNRNTSNQAVDDESKFYNCTFVTDAPLNKPALTPSVIMAHLFGVQSVNFYGCDFKNTANLATIPYLDRGLGIGADNCLLTVTSRAVPGSLTPDRSTFTDLLRGIEAYSSLGSARTTKVVNTDFNNNWRGIYLKTNNLAIITSNYFDVGEFATPAIGSYGLYLDNCDKYKVENNNFNSIPTHSGYVGLYVQNSGTGNNEIYRNNFNNLLIGTQTAGINGALGEGGGTGLEFRCNTYTNIYGMDIVISNNRIKPTHGNCVTMFGPSNNQFSRTTLYGDFYQNNSVTSHVTYQYSQPNSFTIDPIQFNTINTFPTVCSAYVFDPTTSCPVRLTKGQFLLKDEYAAAKQQVATLMAQIDEGNTKGLLAIVQTQSPGNVLNALIEASPYLSDEVLLAYLSTNPPNGNLQQVLTENSPLSEQVMAAVQLLNLPKGIKTIVNNVQTGTSAMQELQTEIAYYKNEVDQIKSDILRYFLFDDAVEERLKEAIEFLNEGVECTKRQCDLVEFYTANKEYAKATQELSVLTDNIEDADYVKLFTNIIELEQTVDPVQELATNPIKQQPIIEVAEAPVRKQESAMAEVMLKRAKLRNYQETIEELNFSGLGLRLMNQEEETSNLKLQTSNTITVYPNPTSNEVNITHNLNLENGKVTFKVYNMLGVEVLNENLTSTNNEVKINNLKAGVYFYTVTQNNQTIKTDKLMVR